jgi:hypothetical protein
MPIRNTLQEREYDKFVESPNRPNKSAIEVVIANPGDISGGGGGGLAANLEIRNASETISALKCLYSVDANSVALSTDNVSFLKASVFGIAITAANTNESMQIQTAGTLRDSSFTWTSGTQLYLGANGSLTDIAPSLGFRTLVANSQGPGQIFINIQETITL